MPHANWYLRHRDDGGSCPQSQAAVPVPPRHRVSEHHRSTTKSFAIDVDAGKRRIAPFVSPLVAGKPVESRRIATTEFAPAYIKDKRALDPMRPVMRALGERIGGVLSAADREMANLAFEMEDQVQMVQRQGWNGWRAALLPPALSQ